MEDKNMDACNRDAKISGGKSVTSREDKLVLLPVGHLYNAVKSPKPELAQAIRNLRIVKDVSKEQYDRQKRSLPYFVCAAFDPPFRKIDNFMSASYFVLDIDKLSAKGLDIVQTRQRIQADDRVLMCFVSPGEDGLKVMFRLKSRCCDSGRYKAFYCKFAHDFSVMYGLEQVIDAKTNDVARACFLSVDPDAYYNEECVEVDWECYVDWGNAEESLGLFRQADAEMKQSEKAEAESKCSEPNADELAAIKARLFPLKHKRQEENKNVYVPEILNDIISDLNKFIADNGLNVTEVRNIQYGKKINVSLGVRTAEVNLFHGRRGFSVVQSPKSGTNEELNALLAEMVQVFLDTYEG